MRRAHLALCGLELQQHLLVGVRLVRGRGRGRQEAEAAQVTKCFSWACACAASASYLLTCLLTNLRGLRLLPPPPRRTLLLVLVTQRVQLGAHAAQPLLCRLAPPPQPRRLLAQSRALEGGTWLGLGLALGLGLGLGVSVRVKVRARGMHRAAPP